MSDLFGNHIVGFPMRRLILHKSIIIMNKMYNGIAFFFHLCLIGQFGGGGGKRIT